MIKILVPGTLKRINCGKCGAVLQYDEKEDVKEECIEKMFSTNMPSGRGRKQKYTKAFAVMVTVSIAQILDAHSARIK